MRKEIVIRAWRDEEFREEMAAADRAALPESPVGLVDVRDEALRSVVGGGGLSIPVFICTRPADSCVQPGQQCP